jgi:calcium-binding protein CML
MYLIYAFAVSREAPPPESFTIAMGNFRQAAIKLGFVPSSDELKLAVKVFDFNGDGVVSYKEFIKFVKGEETLRAEARAALRVFIHPKAKNGDSTSAAFVALDGDNDGVIVPGEFVQVAAELGFQPSSEELKLAVNAFDLNGDGVVSYEEFIKAPMPR